MLAVALLAVVLFPILGIASTMVEGKAGRIVTLAHGWTIGAAVVAFIVALSWGGNVR